jgi:chromatin remodeling complex protein RSC6
MSSSTVSTKKVVAKKVAEPAAAVAAPAPAKAVAAKASPAPVASAAQTKPSPAPSAAPVPSVAPVASVAADAAETTDLAAEIKALHDQLTTLRDTAAAAIVSLKRVTKRAAQEVKDAKKKKRRSKDETTEGGADAPKKESNLSKPTPISDELAAFLGKGKNTSISRQEVTSSLSKYIKEHCAKDGKFIKPDAPLKKLLAMNDADTLDICTLQTFLKRHYLKPAATA